jgi:Mg2+/Co2+ transporter CorC
LAKAGDTIDEEGYRFVVEETDARTVIRVRAEPL